MHCGTSCGFLLIGTRYKDTFYTFPAERRRFVLGSRSTDDKFKFLESIKKYKNKNKVNLLSNNIHKKANAYDCKQILSHKEEVHVNI